MTEPNLIAKARGFALLGGLLIEDFDTVTLATARRTAVVGTLLGDTAPQDLRASHYQTFGLDVFAFGGVYTSESGLVGGPIADAVSKIARDHEMSLSSDVSPDHFGQCLRVLGTLISRRGSGMVSAANHAEATLIDSHLLSWLAPFHLALARVGAPLWRGLTDLAVELIASHRQDLTLSAIDQEVAGDSARQVNHQAPTSIKELAGYLSTPARCGTLLTRSDVDVLSQQLQLPRGFGSREQVIENVFHAAGHYEASPALFQILITTLTEHRETTDAWGPQYDLPHWATTTWVDRLDRAIDVLTQMSRQL